MHLQICNSILFFQLAGHLTRSELSLKCKIWNVFPQGAFKELTLKELRHKNTNFGIYLHEGFNLTKSASLKYKIWRRTSATKDSVGSDRGGALVQYPYWPLTRVAYLGTEGLPVPVPLRCYIDLSGRQYFLFGSCVCPNWKLYLSKIGNLFV